MSERARRGSGAVGRDPESGDPPLRPPAARTVRLRAGDAGTRRCGQRPGRSAPDHPLCSCWSPYGYGVGRRVAPGRARQGSGKLAPYGGCNERLLEARPSSPAAERRLRLPHARAGEIRAAYVPSTAASGSCGAVHVLGASRGPDLAPRGARRKVGGAVTHVVLPAVRAVHAGDRRRWASGRRLAA
jgi:hypothetical protein